MTFCPERPPCCKEERSSEKMTSERLACVWSIVASESSSGSRIDICADVNRAPDVVLPLLAQTVEGRDVCLERGVEGHI